MASKKWFPRKSRHLGWKVAQPAVCEPAGFDGEARRATDRVFALRRLERALRERLRG